MFVVTAIFHPKPDHRAAFLSAMRQNAATSLADEPGCHQFDVCLSDDGAEVFLYEVYTDSAAFDAHLASAHFKAFDAEVGDWVADKSVKTYTRPL